MYNLDQFRSLEMSDFMERMGFEFERGKYNCPICGSGTGKNKSSAFMVYPGERGWYCHACVKGGNIINFMMEWKNLDFKDAIQELAGIYGIDKEADIKPMVFKVFDQVRVFYKMEDALKWERKLLDDSHREAIRKVRILIAELNGLGVIDDSHWLCKCLSMRKKFNPTPEALGMIIDRLSKCGGG